MATQIYKNVFVPDHVTTEQFLKTRAYGYLSLYSDVRFKNWQTSLNVATQQYKLSLDSYSAELKAQAVVESQATKEVDRLKKETAELQSTYLTTAEKETSMAANAKNSANQFNAGQANDARTAAYTAANTARKTEFEQREASKRQRTAVGLNPMTALPAEVNQEIFQTKVGKAVSSGGTPIEIYQSIQADPAFKKERDRLNPEQQARLDAVTLLRSGATEADKAAFMASEPQSAAVFTNAMRLGSTEAGTMDVPGAPGVQGVKPVVTDFGATQLARLRQLYKTGGYEAIVDLLPEDAVPEEVMKTLGIQVSASDLENANQALADLKAGRPKKPTSSLVDDARAIYSASFEQNPYQARLKANTDASGKISDHFVQNRLAALPADASATSKEEARTAGMEDAFSWIMGGYKPESTQPTERPLPLVADDRNVPFSRAPDLRGVIKTDDRNAPFDEAPNLMELIKQRLAPATTSTPEQRDIANELAIVASAPRREPGINGLGSGYVPTPGTVESANLDFPTRGDAPVVAPMDIRGEAVPVAEMAAQPVQPATRPVGPAQPAIKAPAVTMPTVAPVNVAQSFGGTTAPIPSVAGLKAGTTKTPGVTLADRPGTTVEPSGDIENLGASSKVSVATASKTAKAPFSVYMPDDTNYQYEYDGSRDAFTVTDGPKNVGRVFPKGTAAYDALMTQGYTTVDSAPTPAPTPAPAKTQAIKQTVQLTASQLEAQRRADLLASGMELASKPDKLRRILNTTPAGRLVSSLMNAHKQSRDSVTFLQLRQEIERKYIGRPTQIEQAIQILAASFILEAREADKAAP
tara:strand:- start:6090 stop:8522 length:2433 start_codon:yes stop_codon:yes gene_type:complete